MNRPGVRVLFRHGYYASTVVVPTDRKAFITYRRVAAAGQYDKEVPDIKVAVKPQIARDNAKIAREASVDMVIDLSRVAFTVGPVTDKTAAPGAAPENRHLGALDISVFCGDERERLVGELWETAELKLKDEAAPERFDERDLLRELQAQPAIAGNLQVIQPPAPIALERDADHPEVPVAPIVLAYAELRYRNNDQASEAAELLLPRVLERAQT